MPGLREPDAKLNDTIDGRSNNSFDASGISSLFIRKIEDCSAMLPAASIRALGAFDMKLTNDSYIILISTKNFTERYYRDKTGWLKVSARGRRFRMTAEQVLNHILPALAGIKPNLTIEVEHHDQLSQNERSG